MRSRFYARCLALVAVAILLVLGAGGVQAAPAQQNVVTVVVFAYVDVAGNPGSDWPAPACNLEFDTEDEAYAQSNPLAAMEFVLRDGSGTELARQTTTELATLQRARFEDIAEQESYILQLSSPPTGWTLCPQEAADRTLTQTDFSLNRARVTYHFFKSDQGPTPTGQVTTPPTNTPVGPTVTPGGPTVTPRPTNTPRPPVTARPTIPPRPTGETGGGEEDEEEEQQQAQQSSGSVPAPAASSTGMGISILAPEDCTGLSSIKGLAFVDANADGLFEAGEPGLNDVQVRLHGGGLQISQITPATGAFSFEALGRGTYDLFISPGPEWKITTPSLYQVTVRCNIATGYNFGLIRHTDMPAGAKVPAVPAPSAGIKLPATGILSTPQGTFAGGLAAVLALLGLVGLAAERRRTGI